MPARKNWVELLTVKSREDNATNLTINDISIEKCDKVNRDMFCKFVCNCGEEGNKNIRQIVEKTGLFCENCTLKKRLETAKATNLEKYGVENAFQSQKIKEKIKATNLEKYGVENATQSQEVKDKMKATNLEKYGVENAFQSQKIKEKIKATNLEKYGVENATQSQEVKDKIKATSLEKYGVENATQSQEVKDKIKATNLKRRGVKYPTQSQKVREKIKATNLKRLGVENPSQNPNVQKKKKETSLKNYGVEYPMQNKDIFEKCQKKRFKPKPYTFESGELIECQGYEAWALKELEENHNYIYEDYLNKPNQEFWYKTNDGKKHKYHNGCDIPFLKNNKLIEVKSYYTFYADFQVNLLKSQCVIEKGFEYEFWIYNDKKELIIVDSNLLRNKVIVNRELLKI